jgi:hypothetical protein
MVRLERAAAGWSDSKRDANESLFCSATALVVVYLTRLTLIERPGVLGTGRVPGTQD